MTDREFLSHAYSFVAGEPAGYERSAFESALADRDAALDAWLAERGFDPGRHVVRSWGSRRASDGRVQEQFTIAPAGRADDLDALSRAEAAALFPSTVIVWGISRTPPARGRAACVPAARACR